MTPGPSEDAQHGPCPVCAQPMDPQRASYDTAGRLVCASCMAQATVYASDQLIEHKDPTTTKNLWAAAGGAAMLGLGTLCMAFLGRFAFLAGPLAVGVGAITLVRIVRDPVAKKNLGNGRIIAIVLCGLGIVFGLLATGLGLLFMAMS